MFHHLIAVTGIGPGTEEELRDEDCIPPFNADMLSSFSTDVLESQ